jgi:hypothetical protein
VWEGGMEGCRVSKKRLIGIDEIQRHVRLSVMTILDLRKSYDFPITKTAGVWWSTPAALTGWLKQNGLENSWLTFSFAKLKAAGVKRHLLGLGREITGNANLICQKLGISDERFNDVLGMRASPIEHVKGTGDYKVEMSRWVQFCEDQAKIPRLEGLGPPAPARPIEHSRW